MLRLSVSGNDGPCAASSLETWGVGGDAGFPEEVWEVREI